LPDESDTDLGVPLNDFFALSGFSSRTLPDNLGSTAVFLAIFLLLHLLALALRCLTRL
jgi:hypothetical protein